MLAPEQVRPPIRSYNTQLRSHCYEGRILSPGTFDPVDYGKLDIDFSASHHRYRSLLPGHAQRDLWQDRAPGAASGLRQDNGWLGLVLFFC